MENYQQIGRATADELMQSLFGEGHERKSPGAVFVNSPVYRETIEKIRQSGSCRVNLSCEIPTIKNATTSSAGLTSIHKLGGVVEIGTQGVRIQDLIATGTTLGGTVRYIKEDSHTNAATTVAEGAAKPEASFDLSEVDTPVRKIAAWTKVTDELFADYEGVASLINQVLPFMVQQTEEAQILNGDGTGSNLTGILNTSGIQTQAKGADVVADAIFKAITKVRTGAFMEPDGIVMHPNDWEALRLTKDAANRYYDGGPFGLRDGVIKVETAGDFLWGKPVVVTTAIAENTALVGAFRSGAMRFIRSQGLQATNCDGDDFIKNLMTIRAEIRVALAVMRPPSFCAVTGI